MIGLWRRHKAKRLKGQVERLTRALSISGCLLPCEERRNLQRIRLEAIEELGRLESARR